MNKTILNNQQVDQIINQTNQKYLDETNFIKELMDISVYENVITEHSTNILPKIVNLNEVTDFTFANDFISK
jgi:hypothetical protein